MDRDPALTNLLNEMIGGDPESAEAAIALVYGRLHGVAAELISREYDSHRTSATELVHEVYLRKLRQLRAPVASREHFFSVAARAMRQVLVELSREARAKKRAAVFVPPPSTRPLTLEDMVLLHDRLNDLQRIDPAAARALELSYFIGLTHPQISAITGEPERRVRETIAFALEWLRK